MSQLDMLRNMKPEIYRIAKKHRIGRIYIFGSCARNEETSSSDVDLLVELEKASLFDHIEFEDELSALLQKHVDVVSSKALKADHFGARVRQEMIPL